jgi:hypothetical protein
MIFIYMWSGGSHTLKQVQSTTSRTILTPLYLCMDCLHLKLGHNGMVPMIDHLRMRDSWWRWLRYYSVMAITLLPMEKSDGTKAFRATINGVWNQGKSSSVFIMASWHILGYLSPILVLAVYALEAPMVRQWERARSRKSSNTRNTQT